MEYGVFICHSFSHGDIYDELRSKLRRAGYFTWRNESVPEDMLIRSGDESRVREEIAARIARADVVLALTKPIAAHSLWIQKELELSRDLGKPIVAITRRKSDKKSRFVLENSDRHVDSWRTNDIIDAIRAEVKRARKRQQSSQGPNPATAPASATLPREVLIQSIRPVPDARVDGKHPLAGSLRLLQRLVFRT